jgi:tetratricopeptide (TPR) repeat protein
MNPGSHPASPPSDGLDPRLGRAARLLAAGASLAVESKAAWEFVAASAGAAPIFPLLLLHLAACALLALAFLPAHGRDRDRRSFPIFVFAFAFALPWLGMLGILLGVLPALSRPVKPGRRAYGILRDDRMRVSFPAYTRRHGPGGFRARLLASGTPAPQRLGALLALRRRSSPRGNRLLKEMLRDPADELRLAAYAALERMERDSQAALAAAERALRDAGNGPRRPAALRRVASLHWEAAYQELADGEVSRHHLEQALPAAQAVLDLDSGDAFMALLKGRILARLGAWDSAEHAFSEAAGSGAGAARLLPHRAESDFQKRDFAGVRRHLAELRGQSRGGPLEPVPRFWLGG